MSQLVERLNEAIVVERSQFVLKDQDGILDEPAGWPSLEAISARLTQGSWFEATLNWAVFLSSAPWHSTEIALELWDGPPPEDPELWGRGRTVSFYSSSGLVYLSELFGSGPPPVPLDLRRDASEWAIKASSRPGTGWIWPEDGDDEASPRGVEEWRIQFWPVMGWDPTLTHSARRKKKSSPSVQRYLDALNLFRTPGRPEDY